MAAPSGISWGNMSYISGDSSKNGIKLGIKVSVSNASNTVATVSVEVWLYTKWSVRDDNNSIYFNDNATSASSLVASNYDINTSSNSTNNDVNYVKIYSTSFNVSRGTSNATRKLAAKITTIMDYMVSGGISASHSTSYTVPAQDITYYTVTWKDGLGNTIEVDTVASGDSATPPNDPTRAGYTFEGWSGTYKNVTSNQVVNATWTPITYNVDIDCNGGSGVGDFTYTIESPNATLGTPTYEGYTFLGWTGSNGTTPQKSVTIAKGSTGDKSYKANWAAQTFIITYDGNGGTCEIYDYDEDGNPISSTTSTSYAEEVEFASEVYIRPNDDFFIHPDGKGFVNWNTEPDGSGDSWEPGTHTWDGAHDITLYAQWTDAIEYTVTFNANGGKFSDGSTKKTQTVTKGKDATPPTPSPTREGKQFQGWTANYKNITANQVVNAIWGTGVIWIMTTSGWKKFE